MKYMLMSLLLPKKYAFTMSTGFLYIICTIAILYITIWKISRKSYTGIGSLEIQLRSAANH